MNVVCLLLVAFQPLLLLVHVQAFACTTTTRQSQQLSRPSTTVFSTTSDHMLPRDEAAPIINRRAWIQASATILLTTTATTTCLVAPAAWAASRPPLTDLLYTILRVREATEQETRLISSGKFKDVQRANIKLAVRFMVENYRLADAFVAAAAYLDGNERRIAAGNVGQAAVQNLVTILEYFDSADVQNLKVGSNAMAGKEGLVLKGLEATRKNIDEFLTYFSAADIAAAKVKIEAENKLNIEEFDPALGTPINLPSAKV